MGRDDTHGKFCGFCKRFIKGGNVEKHMDKCEKKYEKKQRKYEKKQRRPSP